MGVLCSLIRGLLKRSDVVFSSESYQELIDKCSFTIGVDWLRQPQDVGKDASCAFRQTGRSCVEACLRSQSTGLNQAHSQAVFGPAI